MEGYVQYKYASFWARFWAFLLDNIILSGVALFVKFIYFFAFFDSVNFLENFNYYYENDFSWKGIYAFDMNFLKLFSGIILINLFIRVLYFAGMQSSKLQATIGKIALGIKVVDINGERITFIRGVGRYLIKVISESLIYFFGYIVAAFTKNKQALHDIIAGTLVVKNEREY